MTVIPGNIEIVESEVMTEGKALFFVKGQYVAGAGGKASLQAYDEALARKMHVYISLNNMRMVYH